MLNGPLKIAVAGHGSYGWLGGVTYAEFMFRALQYLPPERRPELYLVLEETESLDLYQETLKMAQGLYFTGTRCPEVIGQSLPPGVWYRNSPIDICPEVDMYFPIHFEIAPHPSAVYWIYDLQHKHFPQFFDPEEVARRDRVFGNFAKHGHTVVTSSETTAREYQQFYPHRVGDTRVLRFYFDPPPGTFSQDPQAVATRYELPEKYFICCNQFWMHKNHIRIFEALAILKRRGVPAFCAFTGRMGDGRDLDWVPRLLEMIKSFDIDDRIKFLNIIPRQDQLQLIRRSLAMLQPSLFEGWSTVIEDGRALGKTMVLSDIAVHLEQAPPHGSFFNPNRSDELADRMEELLQTGRPGPDLNREGQAISRGRELVIGYAETVLELANRCRQQHLAAEGLRAPGPA